MRHKRYFGIVLLSVLIACGRAYEAPFQNYQAEKFDPNSIVQVEAIVRDVAARWELQVIEKDRKSMKVLTFGIDAFHIFLSHPVNKHEVVASIGNSGAGTIISVLLFQIDGFTDGKMHKLSKELIDPLEQQFGLEFCTIDINTSLCVEHQG